MSTALVTGAGGFVARHIAPALRRAGFATVAGADVRPPTPALFDASYVADLTRRSDTLGVIANTSPALIVHLAGSSNGSERDVWRSNVETSRQLIDCVREAAPHARVVLVGSAAEYGDVPRAQQPVDESFVGRPRGAYGVAKAAVSAVATRAAADGVSVVVGRPFNIIGAGIPSTLVVGALVERIRETMASRPPHRVRVGTTSSVRDFVAVEDVVDGLIRAGQRGTPGQAYNLCTGVGHSVAEVLDMLIALSGERIEVERDPALIRDAEVSVLTGSWEKAKRELDWTPKIALNDCVRDTWSSSASTLAAANS